VPPGQALSTGAREEAPVAARDIAPRDSRRREPSADLLRTAASSPVLLSAAASTLATTAQPANVPALVSWANSLGSGGWPEPPAPPAAKSVLKGDGTSDATLLRNRRFLLPKGSFLNCTLETAIDSTLPGMTTCVLAEDAFGADGRIVLLERGTRLIGESRAELRSGQNRVAVEWNDARTPTGVQLVLSSAATDSLGRAGVPGQVDRHLGDRFGAAVFLSFIDAAAGAASARQQSSGTVIYNPQASRDIASEALRASIAIPPTLHVAPGSRIQVIVAADVNFRSVYHLVADELR
jgi:type IV secretion system protein VirB10